jgi:Skp family chaperone for outer membrane proteins
LLVAGYAGLQAQPAGNSKAAEPAPYIIGVVDLQRVLDEHPEVKSIEVEWKTPFPSATDSFYIRFNPDAPELLEWKAKVAKKKAALFPVIHDMVKRHAVEQHLSIVLDISARGAKEYYVVPGSAGCVDLTEQILAEIAGPRPSDGK